MSLEFIITLVIVIIGFLGLLLMNLQLNNQIKAEVRSQFKELKLDIKDLKQDIKDLNTRVDTLSARVDNCNMRIDRLTDAIYAQKTS